MKVYILMNYTSIAIKLVLFTLLLPSFGFASGYRGDFADAWGRASVVVLGVPQPLDENGETVEFYRPEHEGLYRLEVEEIFKDKYGYLPNGDIPGIYPLKIEKPVQERQDGVTLEFVDLYHRSSAALHIRPGSHYLLFLQTAHDIPDHRKSRYQKLELDHELIGLRAIKVPEEAVGEVETGVEIVTSYEELQLEERKKFLLDHLYEENAFAHSFVVRKILRNRIDEAIPYFQKQFSEAETESAKLQAMGSLRILGAPGVKKTLISWLNDPDFTKKTYVIGQMRSMGDKSLIPEIKRFVNDEDELLAVRARTALLKMGEPGAKELLIDTILNSEDSTVRFNAIANLNWHYDGEYSDNEKDIIRSLTEDEDEEERIAREARSIIEEWD